MLKPRKAILDTTIYFESLNKYNIHSSTNGPPFIMKPLFSSGMKYYASAFNQSRNLFVLVDQKRCFVLFTLEGIHITTVPIMNPSCEFFTSGNSKFTDDSIVICNYSGGILYRYSDFNTVIKCMPRDAGRIRKWNCLETDVDGNIYTNGLEANNVLVYSHDLKFKSILSFNYAIRPTRIISLHIIHNIIMTLSIEKDIYQIEKFCLRTSEFIESFAINSILPSDICSDGNNNIVICGKYSDQVCIQALDGTVSYHKFEADKVDYSALDQIVRYISVTDSCQIVLVQGSGQISLASRRQS